MVIIARYQVKAEVIERVLQHARELAAASRGEPGCLDYMVLYSAESPGEVTLVERYEDEQAFEAHINSAHYAEIGKGLIHPLLDGREVARYEVRG